MYTGKFRLLWRKFQRKRRGNGAVHSSALFGLHSANQTAVIIERERSRADRTGSGFSLMVITCIESQQRKAALVRFADYLTTRIRLSDELGWLADNKLAIVLPATEPSGAWRLAELRQDERSGAHAFDYKVYSYPSDEQFDCDVASDDERRERVDVVQ
jgi:GGDEF domain-containing protein